VPLARAVAVMAGLMVTTAGFIAGRLGMRGMQADPAPYPNGLHDAIGSPGNH
jgi:hypothetical protein